MLTVNGDFDNQGTTAEHNTASSPAITLDMHTPPRQRKNSITAVQPDDSGKWQLPPQTGLELASATARACTTILLRRVTPGPKGLRARRDSGTIAQMLGMALRLERRFWMSGQLPRNDPETRLWEVLRDVLIENEQFEVAPKE